MCWACAGDYTPEPPTAPPEPEPRTAPWSFTAPARPALPQLGSDWVRNPIDAFVLQALHDEGLEPAPTASPSTLLRRVALDLTGLPPSPEALAAFLGDPSEAAYAAAVDGLLAEPAYGEHRARYWLDVARYADTHGYHFDNYRSIWPYRDYVIDAFNAGKPFDTFTVEQLAGDLLPDPGSEQLTATGFVRCSMSTNETGVAEEEYAAIYAKDRVDAFASAWLGLTVGCAACHDHKYDPISQADFYSLSAFFTNIAQPVLDGNLPDAPPTLIASPSMTPTLISEEKAGEPFAFVLENGRYDVPTTRVRAAVPTSLPPLSPTDPQNRLGLARWLVRSDNPLMARVVVNRFWAEVFGAGLVRTPNDFGRVGAAPSHPELLDWLAVEFRESGWDVKHLFRLLVTSATYRQSAQIQAEKLELDPDNRLLSRGPRFRMDGEMIRDLALAASGLLVRTLGGASVKPYQPENVWEVVSLPESDTSIYRRDQGDALYRRSLYTFWKRQAPPPALELFNAPSREQSVAQRERTNTPLQALVTMNDVQLVEAARVLGSRALEAETTTVARLDYITRRVLSRSPSEAERGVLEALLNSQLELYRAEPAAADALVQFGDSGSAGPATELAAWTLVASTILNLDEALNK
ncbi:MAG: DUF1549 and DUF1553 domain-containing protein [Polyangiaceae bacterium]